MKRKSFSLVLLLPLLMICFFQPVAAEMPPRELPTILLDPGHGGFDGGAVAPDGTMEKDLNLEIGLKLRDFLSFFGFPVHMTRETDGSLEEDASQSIRKRKVSDIHCREKMGEGLPENGLFLSIHQNKFSDTDSCGTQIFYGTQHPTSQTAAAFLQDLVRAELQPQNRREIKPGTDDIYLLKKLSCPIILVECGFLSNPGDFETIKDPEQQSRYAFLLAAGLLQYYTPDPIQKTATQREAAVV